MESRLEVHYSWLNPKSKSPLFFVLKYVFSLLVLMRKLIAIYFYNVILLIIFGKTCWGLVEGYKSYADFSQALWRIVIPIEFCTQLRKPKTVGYVVALDSLVSLDGTQ